MNDHINFVGSRGCKRSLEVLREVISPSTSDDMWSVWDRDLHVALRTQLLGDLLHAELCAYVGQSSAY